MSHYYIYDENLKNEERIVEYTFKNQRLSFESNSGVFSKDRVDFGTNVLLNSLPDLSNKKRLLDVGCGIGIMGLCIKKAYPSIEISLVDINQRCIELATKNAFKNKVAANVMLSDMYEKVNGMFDLIVSNPPIRAGKKKVFEVVEEAYNHLEDGGDIYCVIQKKQGAESLQKHMEEIFKNVEVVTKEKGYYILKSTK